MGDIRVMMGGVEVKAVIEDGMPVPEYAHEGDAGMDFRITKAVELGAGETRIVPTGVRMAIPEGYVGLCFPRSGLSSYMGVTLANAVGVIDSTYRGEIRAPLHNMTDHAVSLERGERVFQMIVMPYPHVTIDVVESLDDTDRGEGGFGSSGRS